MKKNIFLISTIVCLLGLFSCTPINFIKVVFQPTPTSMPTSSWLQNWLKNEPNCQMPCWQQISPGNTSMAEARTYLQEMNDVIELSHFLNEDKTKYLEIYWRFSDGGTGTITTQKDGQLVKSISLQTDPNQKITLDQVIESYGDPDSIILADCRGEFSFSKTCAVVFVYLDLGMVVESELIKDYGPSGWNIVHIEEKTRIGSFALIVPTEEGFQGRLGRSFSDYGIAYQPWKGYGTYPQ
jgi:hypothetical protein